MSDTYAYVADGPVRLHKVDISEDPSAPHIVATCATVDYSYGVAVRGNYAYVADGNSGLKIIDLSSFSIAYSCNTPGTAGAIALSEDYAYIADVNGGLKIIDTVGNTSGTFEHFAKEMF